MSRAMPNTKGTNRGFLGDLVSSVVQPLGALAGTFLGGPLGGIIGSGLGSAISPLAKRIPFKRGGVIMKGMHMMPDGSMMKNSDMKKKKAKKAPAKGSKAMKMKMAKLRAMRK